MTAHHDSAAFLEVVWSEPMGRGATGGPGWYVRRNCTCHFGALVSMPFVTRAQAERCREVLDADCRRTLARRSAS